MTDANAVWWRAELDAGRLTMNAATFGHMLTDYERLAVRVSAPDHATYERLSEPGPVPTFSDESAAECRATISHAEMVWRVAAQLRGLVWDAYRDARDEQQRAQPTIECLATFHSQAPRPSPRAYSGADAWLA